MDAIAMSDMGGIGALLCSASKHNCASGSAYPSRMQSKATLALRDNVARLMEHTGMSQRELAKEAGISQRAVGYLLQYKDINDRHPTTSTIEAVAQVFNLDAWQLMIPNQPLELLLSQRLKLHTMDYMDVGNDGRAAVDRITEVEVRIAGSTTDKQETKNLKQGSRAKAG